MSLQSFSILPVHFLVMLLLILITMTLFLYQRWQNKVYFILSLVFGFSLVPYLPLMFGVSLYSIFSISTSMAGIILIQSSFHFMYKQSDKKNIIFNLGIVGVVFLLVLISLFIKMVILIPILILLTLGSTAYHWHVSPSQLKSRRHYIFALVILCISLSICLVNVFLNHLTLAFIHGTLLLCYYFFLFLLLFERVVNMVHAATYSSRTDALTGLYNRKEFNKQVNRFIEENNPISVIFVDIDNFKKLNDTQGHAKGDEELRGVAKIISEETSGIGIAGRYGGEEMVVLITDCNVHLATVCENIRSRVEKEMIVTLSIGYSQSTDEIKGDQLIKQADEAMYKAKTTGKNKVVGWA